MHLGIDIGSSSVKVALIDREGRAIAEVREPSQEMPMKSLQAGWAEQDPEMWWQYTCEAIEKITSQLETSDILSIGLAHQMHGLVLVDQQGNLLRDAIIWCDSRAVPYGSLLADHIGTKQCLDSMLNLPGNFTASKLAWIREHEPDIYKKIACVMLPGDYICYRLTGELSTTAGNLSEGCFWDFKGHRLSPKILEALGLSIDHFPAILQCMDNHGVTRGQIDINGLPDEIPVCYKAGDQPNNAYALGVTEPGQVAGTGGTSGVIYAVTDKLVADPSQAVNSFAHFNHSSKTSRIGILLCINSVGILYAWMRRMLGDLSYGHMEELASRAPVGSDGLAIIPFGNGAERMLGNQPSSASIHGIQLNRHDQSHLIRAALEGLAFSYAHGIEKMRALGVEIHHFRVGNDNLFQSEIFAQSLADLSQCEIEVIECSGAVGAARGGAHGGGHQLAIQDQIHFTYSPRPLSDSLSEAYQQWSDILQKQYP